jgi:hypothetical protein
MCKVRKGHVPEACPCMRAFSLFQCKVQMLYTLDLFIRVTYAACIYLRPTPAPTTRSHSAFQRKDSFSNATNSVCTADCVQ